MIYSNNFNDISELQGFLEIIEPNLNKNRFIQILNESICMTVCFKKKKANKYQPLHICPINLVGGYSTDDLVSFRSRIFI